MKDIYSENYKTLMRGIAHDTEKWNISCSWIGSINMNKMATLPKAFYGFNAIPLRIPITFFFHRTRANNLKIHMQPQKTPNCQRNLEKKKQSWRYHSPRLQAILQTYFNQNSMVVAQKQTHRWVEQNREPITPHTYVKLIYHKEGKNMQWKVSLMKSI